MSKRKDLIGPTFNQHKAPVVPKGPTADLTTAKGTKGMAAARRLLSGQSQDVQLEGTPVEGPLSLGAPILPVKPAAEGCKDGEAPPQEGKSKLPPQAMLGPTHVDSYQTLLANDRMAKPLIKAWDEDE